MTAEQTTEQTIDVDCAPDGTGWACNVRVGHDPQATSHQVRVDQADLNRLAPGAADPTELVTESFRFMLEREPREQILRSFALPVIGRYFPEYEQDVTGRMDGRRRPGTGAPGGPTASPGGGG
jgi:hypothetical protein